MVGLFLLDSLRSVIAVVAVFVVCIVIHEFGHFYVAKRAGVAVPAFAIGFGPKLFKWTRNKTEFSIRLFPLGGLVQLAGEVPQDSLFREGEKIAFRLNQQDEISMLGDAADVPHGKLGIIRALDLTNRLQMTLETPEDGVQTYQVMPHAKLMTGANSSLPIVEKSEQVLGKKLWQRAAIILAGPVMNFILAGVLFTIVNFATGVPTNAPTLGQIVPGSAAAAAGLHQGDRVLSVDGRAVQNWPDLVAQIHGDTSNPPKPLQITFERGGTSQSLNVTPRLENGRPLLGVNPPVTYNPVQLVANGFSSVYDQSVTAIQLYGQVITHHQFSDLSGPVGIADVISQQAQNGVMHVIFIAALLSLNLGLFNLLPIPALDGGRLFFMLVELVRGRSFDPRKEGLVHFVGFALLMLFAVVITYRDVTRLF